MGHASCVAVTANYLATVVDPGRESAAGVRYAKSSRIVKRGNAAANVEEAMVFEVEIGKISHNLAAVIDTVGKGARGAGVVDCTEGAAAIQEAVKVGRGRNKFSNDLAVVVDSVGFSLCAAWVGKTTEVAVAVDKTEGGVAESNNLTQIINILWGSLH
ncbi:MAG TPA: hypothetical protein VMJ75_24095 [Candidatus Acidoferrales bacterium]|nr:hypothetical protein [Candidatus Acidoferrales bacterium]